MSQIDMIKGHADAQNEQVQAILNGAASALIKKLLDMMSGGAQGIT